MPVNVRAALMDAAQQLLGERGTAVSIQDLCERAGVSPASLYNHFKGKDELLAEATEAAITEFEVYMFVSCDGITDPIARFCTDIRLYGRMPDSHPLLARVMTMTAIDVVGRPRGYNERAYGFVAAVVATGRIQSENLELSLLAAFAAAERLVAVRLNDPAVGPERADDLAAFILTWFGIPRQRARALASRPLPSRQGMAG